MDKYQKRILGEAAGKYEEKKSRFLAFAAPASSEEEALAYIEGKKKEFWDARHNCSAYIIGEGMPKTHCSDDGEPSGTAGRPMLEVLEKEGLSNIVAVVTRYFGGVLLGTGGLVRAYQRSLKDALLHGELAEKREGAVYEVLMDYNVAGKLNYYLSAMEIPVLETTYQNMVKMRLLCPLELCRALEKKITELSSGAVTPKEVDRVGFGITSRGVHIF